MFADDNEYFNWALNEIKVLLSLTDEQIEDILRAAEIEA